MGIARRSYRPDDEVIDRLREAEALLSRGSTHFFKPVLE